MNKEHGEGKHVRRSSEIDGESARVRFSPELLRTFTELEAAVRDSKHFDRDLLVNLQELAAGKNYTVRAALTNIGLIAQETTEYIQKTDDERAKLALLDVFDKLMGTRANSKPVTVVAPIARGR